MPLRIHAIFDVNVADINSHYYDLFYAYRDLPERGVDAADEPDIIRFRLIMQATYAVAHQHNLGQTWEQVLAQRPLLKRVTGDDGQNYIIESQPSSDAASRGDSTETQQLQADWLIDNNFLPRTPRGKLYPWQPDVVLRHYDDDFGFFFTLKLCTLKPSKVSRFLDYQLANNYKVDWMTFDQETKFLPTDHKEWFSVPESVVEARESWLEHQRRRHPDVYGGVEWTTYKAYFIKLVYSLHRAGFLNDGQGSPDELCVTIARNFGVSYEKGDKTLTNSLNMADKSGHKHDHFLQLITDAYHEYVMEKEKKRAK